jgi:hypothetical protein
MQELNSAEVQEVSGGNPAAVAIAVVVIIITVSIAMQKLYAVAQR